MVRPTLASKISLPGRLKNNSANGASTTPSSGPTSRSGSPKSAMSEPARTGLVLRANVIKVRPYPASPHTCADSCVGTQSGCKGPQRHLRPRESPPSAQCVQPACGGAQLRAPG